MLNSKIDNAGDRRFSGERWSWMVDVLAILLLTGTTVLLQVQRLGVTELQRVSYIEGEQLRRHNAVLDGNALSPSGYRLLSEYVAEGFIRSTRAIHLPHPVIAGFLMLRMLQNVLLFTAALYCYRLLGLARHQSFIGIVVLSYSMSHALYNSDLSFNLYSDICFYLVAACITLKNRRLWLLLPLSFLAALNRETSLFIPFLPLAPLVASGLRSWRSWKPQILFAAACSLVQVVTLVTLRLLIHPPSSSWQVAYGNVQGWPTVWMNLTSTRTLLVLGLTLSVLPIAALYNFRNLPVWLKGVFWTMVPIWFLVHLAMVYGDETRIFLVPVALFFVPAALYSRDFSRTVGRPGSTSLSPETGSHPT